MCTNNGHGALWEEGAASSPPPTPPPPLSPPEAASAAPRPAVDFSDLDCYLFEPTAMVCCPEQALRACARLLAESPPDSDVFIAVMGAWTNPRRRDWVDEARVSDSAVGGFFDRLDCISPRVVADTGREGHLRRPEPGRPAGSRYALNRLVQLGEGQGVQKEDIEILNVLVLGSKIPRIQAITCSK